jgi:hypothetical protein
MDYINFLKKNIHYIVFLFVLLVIIFNKQTILEGFQSNESNIHYGDEIKIQFKISDKATGYTKEHKFLTLGNKKNNDILLKSIKPDYNDDKMVYLDNHSNDLYQYWKIVGPSGTTEDYNLGKSVNNGDIIRLQSVKNGANLYLSSNILNTPYSLFDSSQNIQSLVDSFTQNKHYNITGNGEYNKTDTNANWTLKLSDSKKVWSKNDEFNLVSSKNNLYLFNNPINKNFLMPTENAGNYKKNMVHTGKFVFEKSNASKLFNVNEITNNPQFTIDLNKYEDGIKLLNKNFNNRYDGFIISPDNVAYFITKSDYKNIVNSGQPCTYYEFKNVNPLKSIVSSTNKKIAPNMVVNTIRSQETLNLVLYQNNEYKSLKNEYKLVSINKNESEVKIQLNKFNINSIIIPEGFNVKLYSLYLPSNDDNSNRFITENINEVERPKILYTGKHNNLGYSGVEGILIEKFCPAKVYENSNYKGKIHCLDYGTHKLSKIGSWKVSDNSDAKILTNYADYEMVGDSNHKNTPNYRAINQVNLDTSNTFIVQPRGTDINVFRDLADMSSIKTMNVPMKSEEIPYIVDKNNNIKNIKLENLKMMMDFSNPRTYNDLKPGRIVRDISGKNNHIVFNKNPNVKNGLLLGTTGNVAKGPSVVNYDLGNGINGYTIVLYAKRYGKTTNNILNIESNNKKYSGHGINIHFTFNDNNMYFDNGFTNQENYSSNNARLSNTFDNETLEQMNVYVFRKRSETNGGLLDIFRNGKLVKSSSKAANRLDLNESKFSSLFSDFNGLIQSFMFYNTELDTNEVGNVVNWVYKNQELYNAKLNGFQNDLLSKIIPDLKVYGNLKCIVNSKEKISSAVDSDKLTDLSGLYSNFKFYEIPKKENGRYENIREKGKYLIGQPGSTLRIDRNTGYTIFMTVRLLNSGNYYLFNIRGNNEPYDPVNNKFNRGISLFVEDKKLVLVQGQIEQNIKNNKNRLIVDINKLFGKTITIGIRNNVDQTSNKGKLDIFINNDLVAKGVSNTSNYVNLNDKPIILCAPYELDLQNTNSNRIMDGDLLSFSIYNRGLSNHHLKTVSAYLMRGFYGTNVNLYNVKVKKHQGHNISDNFCQETTLDGHTYSNTECMSWNKKDSEGRFRNTLPNASGWCFTNDEGTSKGFCVMEKDFKLIPSVPSDINKGEKEIQEKIKENAQKQANKELLKKNLASQNKESFKNYEGFANEIPVQNEYDFTGYNNYTEVVDKCINVGGRLCSEKEILPGGKDSKIVNTLFNLNDEGTFKENHPKYTEAKCNSLGLKYDDNTKHCYDTDKINDTKSLPPMNYNDSGNGEELWMPISLDNYSNIRFMNISNNSSTDVGVILKDQTEIETNIMGKPNTRKIFKCCGVGKTTSCEGNKTKLQLLEKKYTNALNKYKKLVKDFEEKKVSNIIVKKAENSMNKIKKERDDIQEQIWIKCDKQNYYDALSSLKKYRGEYNKLVNEHKIAKINRVTIENQMMKFIYFEDGEGKKHVENDSSFSRKRKGLIPDLESEIKLYKKMIKNELERIQNCPTANPYNISKEVEGGKPSCERLAQQEKPTELSFAQQPKQADNRKCSPVDIKNYILNSGMLDQSSISRLIEMSNPSNLLKDKDIREHKDFYKFVKLNKVNRCPKAGKDAEITIKQKTVKDFNIKDHPDYEKYTHIDAVPKHRIPEKYLKK